MTAYSINNMPSTALSYSPGLWVSRGLVDQHSVVHKFGHNAAVGTAYTPIAEGGVWQTPQPAAATALRVKAGGNAGDTNGGAGAWEVLVEGIGPDGSFITDILTLAGASASAATTETFMRITRFFVSKSGSYGTGASASHLAEITIENAAGGTDWGTIPLNGFARSQSQIGAYTVPLGFTAYLQGVSLQVEANKPVNVLFLQRTNILQAAPPYTGVRTFLELVGLQGPFLLPFIHPIKFEELTDFGARAKVPTTTAEVSLDMEIVLVKNTA